jgi:hypothetical protein
MDARTRFVSLQTVDPRGYARSSTEVHTYHSYNRLFVFDAALTIVCSLFTSPVGSQGTASPEPKPPTQEEPPAPKISVKAMPEQDEANPERRFRFDLGISVDSNIAEAQNLTAKTLLEMDGVMEQPPPSANVHAIGDSNATLRVLGWVDQRQFGFLQVIVRPFGW